MKAFDAALFSTRSELEVGKQYFHLLNLGERVSDAVSFFLPAYGSSFFTTSPDFPSSH